MGTTDVRLICVCVLFIASVIAGQRVNRCKPEKCDTPSECTVDCINGKCDEKGQCACSPCWSGVSCDIYENQHIPTFHQRTYDTTITPKVSKDQVVFKVTAKDDDLNLTCKGPTTCECAEIVYLLEGSNAGNTFGVNPESGSVYIKDPSAIVPGATFKVILMARNNIYDGNRENLVPQSDDLEFQSSCTLNIHVSVPVSSDFKDDTPVNGLDIQMQSPAEGHNTHSENKYKYNPFGPALSGEDQSPLSLEHHARHKRSATPIPDNLTNTLEKTGGNENETNIHIGEKMCFQLTLHFPLLTTDVLVELFTPDNESTIMILCDVKIASVGSNLDADPKTAITLDSKDGSTWIDRAIINFGNVTNSGANSADATKSQILITWCVQMTNNPKAVNGSTYYVSAGAEYGSFIWVAQALLKAITDPWTPSTQPTFTLSGEQNPEIGSAAHYDLVMKLPYPAADVTIDVFAPLNTSDIMSVCGVAFLSAGDNYKCYDSSKLNTEFFKKTSTAVTNWRARLPLGVLLNSGARDPSNTAAKNELKTGIDVYMIDDASHVGQTYELGAAVSMALDGSADVMWAGSLTVTGTAKTSPSVTGTMSPTLTTVTSSTVGVDDSVLLHLELNVQIETTYEIDVTAESGGGKARMKVCNVKVIEAGANVPCHGTQLPVYSSTNNDGVNNRAVYLLGKLKPLSRTTDATGNKLKLQIAVQVLSHSENTNGQTTKVTVGVKYGDKSATVLSNPITIGASQSVSDNSTIPTISMSYTTPSDTVYGDASVETSLKVVTVPAALYKPFDIEVITPYENDSLVMSVCRLEVTKVGSNLPCFSLTQMNSLIEYVTKPTDARKYYKAKLSPVSLCNIGTKGDNATTEDEFELSAAVQVNRNHVKLATNGTKVWISMGVQFQGNRLWVGQLALYSMTGTPPDLTVAPYVALVPQGTSGSDIFISGHAELHLYIKLPPHSTTSYRVTVDVTDKLHICNVRILSAARNIPCLDKLIEANYTKQADLIHNKDAILEIGVLSNVGNTALVGSPTIDDNTVIVAVIVSLPDATTAVGSSHTVTAKVDHGTKTITKTQNLNAVVGTAPNTTASNKPTFSFSIGPDFADTTRSTFAKGETARFHLDITLQRGTTLKLKAKLFAPLNITGCIEVCDVSVVFVGQNIPCVNKDALVFTPESRSGSTYTDIGTLDLGFVCNTQIVELANVSDPDADTLRIEFLALIRKDCPTAACHVSATVLSNDDQLYVNQLGFTVTDTLASEVSGNETLAPFNITFNLTESLLSWGIGEVKTIPFFLTLPPNSVVKLLVDAKMPANAAAVMTVKDMRITSAGANMACILKYKDLLLPFLNSTHGTCQMDRGFIDFGIVTNTGRTYRAGIVDEATDNTLSMEVDVQLMDENSTENAASYKISIGAQKQSDIMVTDTSVVVVRTGNEKPNLTLTAEVNASLSTTDTLVIDAVVGHGDLSSAEAYDVTVTFYFPLVLSYHQIAYTNFTSPAVSKVGLYGVAFKWSLLYFCDIVHIRFELKSISPTTVASSVLSGNVTITTEAVCRAVTKPPNANNPYYTTIMSELEAKVQGPKITGCDSSLKFSASQDCQISSSGSPHVGNEAKEARTTGAGFIMSGRRSSPNFLGWNVGNKVKVTKVKINHVQASCRVTSVLVKGSADGYSFGAGAVATFAGSAAEESGDLAAPVEGRFIRMLVQTHTGDPYCDYGVKVEFYGCELTTDVATTDICKWGASWTSGQTPHADFSFRNYVTGSGDDVFLCDVQDFDSMSMGCFAGRSGSWTALDENVGSMLGYHPDTDSVFAIATDRRSCMVSEDKGDSWFSVPPSRWEEVKLLPGSRKAIGVPFLSKSTIQTNSAQYISGNWAATFTGLSKKSGGTWVEQAKYDT